ncbi:M23 family metallopeptidase [Sphingomonas soli]|uniref:M23 family metallopeptidase n=1 Tax=Sphingomonas soli TaxID=266127 RepID=UPI000AB2097D|nr:M23 family metallopeptidase [Sphingomonas soli]
MSLAARLPAAAALWVLLGTCVDLPRAGAADAYATGALPQAPQADPASRFAFEGQMIQGGAVIGVAPKGATLLTLDGASVPIALDRRFLIAFDRDAGPSATLVATLGNGQQVRKQLTIAPRAWDISRLNTLPKYPVPRPEFERVRPGELAQINAARRMQSDSTGWRQAMLWPVVGRISTLFGSQRIYAGEPGSYHSGIDIARPTGTVVLAPADGVVVLAAAKPFTLEGNLLMVDHGAGLNSAFMHLSKINVRVGEHVRRGQPIGAVGMTGRATGPHLHWSLKWRDSRIDPLLLAGPMPVAE